MMNIFSKRPAAYRARAVKTSWLSILTALLLSPYCSAQTPLAHAQSWDHIEQAFEDEIPHVNYWQWGWTTFFASTLVVNLYESNKGDSDDDRYDARVNAISSLLGLIDTLADPQPHKEALNQIRDLKQDAANHPERADENLQQAEQLFLETAQKEKARKEWSARTDAILSNVVAGLAIGLGDNRPSDGLKRFGLGMLVSEIKLQTQPNGISKKWRDYQPIELTIGRDRLTFDYRLLATPQTLHLQARF